MIIPLRLLWDLRVNRRQKIALTVIFSLVFIIIIFAIVRVIQISPASEHVDPIWLALWSMTEGSIGRHSRPLIKVLGGRYLIPFFGLHSGYSRLSTIFSSNPHSSLAVIFHPSQTHNFWVSASNVGLWVGNYCFKVSYIGGGVVRGERGGGDGDCSIVYWAKVRRASSRVFEISPRVVHTGNTKRF